MDKFIGNFFNVLISKDSFLTILGGFVGAFFAFWFFIVSEKRKENKEKINNMWYLSEYLGNLLLIFEFNNIAGEAMKKMNHTNITVDKYRYFKVQDNVFFKLGAYKITQEVFNFNLVLRDLNNNFEILNDIKSHIQDFILESNTKQIQNEYKITIESNIKSFLEKQEKMLKKLKRRKNKLENIISLAGFYNNYFSSNNIKKVYYKIRIILDKDYREKWILKNQETK